MLNLVKSESSDSWHNQIKEIFYLRGIAVLLVLFSHFFYPALLNISDPSVEKFRVTCGHAGVVLFFTISGFIVPYMLFRSDYKLSGFFRYMYRRMLRIEIPYLAILLLILLLSVPKLLLNLSVNYSDGWKGILAHLLYLNDILGYKWLAVVLWTLAIEFQYYIFIGLVFPLINFCKTGFSKTFLLLFLCSLAAFKIQHTFTIFIPFFIAGTGTCLFFLKKINTTCLLVILFFAATTNMFVSQAYPIADFLIVAFFPFFVLGKKGKKHKFVLFTAQISYSIYLIHSVVGDRFAAIIIYLKIPAPLAGILYIILATALSYFLAVLFFKYVEFPSHRCAKRISLK